MLVEVPLLFSLQPLPGECHRHHGPRRTTLKAPPLPPLWQRADEPRAMRWVTMRVHALHGRPNQRRWAVS